MHGETSTHYEEDNLTQQKFQQIIPSRRKRTGFLIFNVYGVWVLSYFHKRFTSVYHLAKSQLFSREERCGSYLNLSFK